MGSGEPCEFSRAAQATICSPGDEWGPLFAPPQLLDAFIPPGPPTVSVAARRCATPCNAAALAWERDGVARDGLRRWWFMGRVRLWGWAADVAAIGYSWLH